MLAACNSTQEVQDSIEQIRHRDRMRMEKALIRLKLAGDPDV